MSVIVTPLYDWNEALLVAQVTGYPEPAPITTDEKNELFSLDRELFVASVAYWLFNETENGKVVPDWVEAWLDMQCDLSQLGMISISSDDERLGDLALKYRDQKPTWEMLDAVWERLAR